MIKQTTVCTCDKCGIELETYYPLEIHLYLVRPKVFLDNGNGINDGVVETVWHRGIGPYIRHHLCGTCKNLVADFITGMVDNEGNRT